MALEYIPHTLDFSVLSKSLYATHSFSLADTATGDMLTTGYYSAVYRSSAALFIPQDTQKHTI